MSTFARVSSQDDDAPLSPSAPFDDMPAPTDDDNTFDDSVDPFPAPVAAPVANEEPETDDPTPNPVASRETQEPTQFEEETPEPTIIEELTPEPTIQFEDTSEPTSGVEDTPEPSVYVADTTEPTFFVDDTTEPTFFVDDTTEPTFFVEETTEPTLYVKETFEPSLEMEETNEPTFYVPDTPEPTSYDELTLGPTNGMKTTPEPTWQETPTPSSKDTQEPTWKQYSTRPVPSPTGGSLWPMNVLTLHPVLDPVAGLQETKEPTLKQYSGRPVPFPTGGSQRPMEILTSYPVSNPAVGSKETQEPTWKKNPGSPALSPTGVSQFPMDIATAHPGANPVASPSEPATRWPFSNPSANLIPGDLNTMNPSWSPMFDSSFDYYDLPEERWVVSLNNFLTTSELAKGNAVVVSPDGVLLYITRDRGRLDVLSAIDGSFRYTFTPPRVEPGYFPIECHSAVIFAALDDGQTVALYTVIDVPQQADNSSYTEARSRIIAIAHPIHRLLWESDPVPGIVEGDPVVTKGPDSGKYLFVTHNTYTSSTNVAGGIGHFSMLDLAAEGKVVFTESLLDSKSNITYPFGPLGVFHGTTPTAHLFDSFPNTNDVLVWASKIDSGRAPFGYLWGFQLPDNVLDLNTSATKMVLIGKVGWNAVARPTFTEDGQFLFLGISNGIVRGWVADSSFTEEGDWSFAVDMERVDPREPIQNSPILSKSEDLLFISGAQNALVALESRTGRLVWQTAASDPVLTEPKLCPDNRRLYFVSEVGVFESYSVGNGTKYWEFACDFLFDPSCVRSVIADFALAPDGMTLYYGDLRGNIRALQLGSPKGPSQHLTFFPSSVPLPSVSTTPSAVGYTRPPVSQGPSVRASLTALPTDQVPLAPDESQSSCGCVSWYFQFLFFPVLIVNYILCR